MEKMKVDYSLYLVTDRTLMSTQILQEAVEQAILGGVTMVQLREKNATALEFFKLAKEIKEMTDKYHVPLIINDRIDVALAVDASGVHVGQKDIPPKAVRNLIGQKKLLGVSASSLQEAIRAQADGADYLGVGAMLPTRTKQDASYVTFEELSEIRKRISLPIVAIGGINKGNALRFKECGVDGLAVVSAIIAQPDIRLAAEELAAQVRMES